MTRDDLTPSKEVDQKKLVNDKVEKAKANDFKGDHIRRVTQNGADGQ